MLTALAGGESTIDNFLCSQDCLDSLRAVESLGAGVKRDGATVTVRGTGGRFEAPRGVLDLGNSGTGLRLLAGLVAGHDFGAELTGDESLCSRPMGRIGKPLTLMGARVDLSGARGCAPMRISGGALHGISYRLPVASAQVKSCVLLAGLFAEGRTEVIEPKPTRDHTERLLAAMGVPVGVDGLTVSLTGYDAGPVPINPGRWRVPGDFSAAAFWLTAAACCEGTELRIEGVGLNPRRTAFLDVLRRMGAGIEFGTRHTTHGTGNSEPFDFAQDRLGTLQREWEPAGDVVVRGAQLKGIVVEGEEIPNLIDELPLVAVAGALAEGQTVIRDAAELRVKESDRIAAMAENLQRLGVPVQETTDGLTITGSARISGDAQLESYGDHRVAMAVAVLGLYADAPVQVRDTACIATSYPGFWEDMGRITGD